MSVRPLIAKLRDVMPEESTIDLNRHAVLVAQIVTKAKLVATARHDEYAGLWLKENDSRRS